MVGLSDSGGVQEETPSKGTQAPVIREVSERPDCIVVGNIRHAGACEKGVIKTLSLLFSNPEKPEKKSSVVNPYGELKAAKRIVDVLERWL